MNAVADGAIIVLLGAETNWYNYFVYIRVWEHNSYFFFEWHDAYRVRGKKEYVRQIISFSDQNNETYRIMLMNKSKLRKDNWGQLGDLYSCIYRVSQ